MDAETSGKEPAGILLSNDSGWNRLDWLVYEPDTVLSLGMSR